VVYSLYFDFEFDGCIVVFVDDVIYIGCIVCVGIDVFFDYGCFDCV